MKLSKSKPVLKIGILILSQIMGVALLASDHDDGETSTKGRNVNLTDLFVFRKDWQTGNTADNGKLILIMNFNPRSLPSQQYYAAAQTARYSFHASRVGGSNSNQKSPTGKEDIASRAYHSFSDSNKQQSITLELVKNGQVVAKATKTTANVEIKTTPLGVSPIVNVVNLGGTSIKVFDGLREDPFFFDVNAFFKTRASLASHASNPTAADIKLSATTGEDFTKNLNVISLAIEAPISLFQTADLEKTLDFWETIEVLK